MATNDETKTLTLRVKATDDASQVLSNVSAIATNLGTTLTGLTTIISKGEDGLYKYAHSFKLVGESAAALQLAAAQAAASMNMVPKSKPTTSTISNIYAERSSEARTSDTDAVARAKSIAAQLVAIERDGDNSITAIHLAKNESLRRADEALYSQLKDLRQKYASGEIQGMGGYTAQRTTLLNAYEDSILQINKTHSAKVDAIRKEEQLERDRIALIERKMALESALATRRVAQAQSFSSQEVAAMNSGLKVQLAALEHGANSRQALIAQSNQKEIALREQLNSTLASLDRQRAAGLLSSTEHQKAVRDATASTSKEIVTNRDTLLSQVGALKAAETQTRQFTTSLHLMLRTWTDLHRVGSTVVGVIGSLVKVGVELDSTKASLQATMGSAGQAEGALAALDKEAQRTGLNISSLRESFRLFQASTSLAGASTEQTWRMYTKLNEAMVGLHLSSDKVNGVFNAVTQIFNKNKVQSEELVKQLGNLLPGAFAAFAKSMDISTQELSKRMKNGQVMAQDTMQGFIEFYANRYAPAFAAAQNSINANIGRFESAWIKLKEKLYDSGSPAINQTLRSLTAGLDSVTGSMDKVLSSANYVGSALVKAFTIQAIIFGAIKAQASLKAALDASRASADGLGQGLTRAGAAATALGSVGMTVLITGLVMAGREAYNFLTTITRVREETNRVRHESAQLWADRRKEATEAGRIELKVEQSPMVKTAKELWEAEVANLAEAKKARAATMSPFAMPKLDAEIERAQQTQATSYRNYLKAQTLARADATRDEIEANKANWKAKTDANEAAAEANAAAYIHTHRTVQDEIKDKLKTLNKDNPIFSDAAKYKAALDSRTKLLEENRAKLKAKSDPSITDETLAGQQEELDSFKRSQESYEKAKAGIIANIQDEQARKSAVSSKKAGAEALAATKEQIDEFRAYAKTEAAETTTRFKEVEAKFSNHDITLAQLFSEKKRILEEGYKTEREYYVKQAELAKSTGKSGLTTRYSEQVKQLDEKFKAESATLAQEETRSFEERKALVAELTDKYYTVLGIEKDSVEESKAKYIQLEAQLQKEAELGDAEAKRLLNMRKVTLQGMEVARDMAKYDRQLQTQLSVTESATRRIQTLKSVGAISDLRAASMESDVIKEQIRLKEEYVRKSEGKLDMMPAGQQREDLVEKVRAAKAEIEDLGLVSNRVGMMFEQSLGNAFENAFTGLINGSMNAKQAFSAFATSVVADIGRIIAQEIKSQIMSAIFRPMIGAALGGLGGLFSNPLVTKGASVAAQDTLVWAHANGGVRSGSGISAYSGTVVDRPTVFPFAKGVGLMGEAGAEAILPLKRNSQGKLGVTVENGGQAANNNVYYINTTVNTSSSSTADEIGNKVAEKVMRSIAQQEINSAARRGNSLNRITKYG